MWWEYRAVHGVTNKQGRVASVRTIDEALADAGRENWGFAAALPREDGDALLIFKKHQSGNPPG
jgi:hypothetical protein